MKLITILITVACLHVSAKGLAQRITLTEKNAALSDIVNSIQRQSGYQFFYKGEQLANIRVSIRVKDATVADALTQALKGLPFTYTITDKIIVIKRKDVNDKVPNSSTVTSQAHDITVHVTDSTGQPLAGASVRIKDTNRGATTNESGDCILTGIENDVVIVITYTGYATKELTVGSREHISVVLSMNVNALEEVVVNKGYYTTTQRLNTGNVSVVKGEDIQRQPVSDPILALEGRVPGLQISQRSGLPGAAPKVQLRGQNSIANGNDPLYIVDGIPYTSSSLTNFTYGNIIESSPFNSLNINDIDNITVLKDADATAIYGSRGANGVILITTKKGKAGKTNIDFNVASGFGKVTRMLDLMDTKEYLKMRHRAFTKSGVNPGPTDYDINGTWDTTRYTDWQKYFIGNTSHYTEASGSVSGGNESTQFLLSGTYHKETTVFPGDFYDRKISFHTGISHTSRSKRFQTDFTASYINDYSHLPSADISISQIFLPPNAPSLYDPNGNLNWEHSTWTNPLSPLLQSNNANTNNLLSNLKISYSILPDLKISSGFSYNNIEMNQNNLTPFASLNPSLTNSAQRRKNIFSTTQLTSWNIEPQLNYNKRIKRSQIDLLLGTTFHQNTSNSISQSAIGFSSDDQIENIKAASNITIGSYTVSLYKYNAFYGRIGYSYDGRYIVNLTARRDGSSRFGPGKQFGNFGAAGVAWLFSKEKWIQNALPFLHFGKLRASYGSTGNDQLGNYKFLSTYTSTSYSYQGLVGQYPTQLTNPDFAWERVNKLETGLELGLLHDCIHIEASWYRNRTSNQLVGYSLPAITGFTTVQANLPAIIQNTGFEFILNTRNISGKKFSWISSVNISVPRNKLISYPNIEGSSYAYRYVVGQPLFINFAYHYTGVNPQTGYYDFEDINKDGQITSPQDYKPVFVGVDFSGGLSNNISFKGWELDCFFQFVKQTGSQFVFNNLPGLVSNQPTALLNSGQPLLAAYTGNYLSFIQYRSSDGLYGDASYIRLKNISLSWQIPKSWCKSMHIQSLKLYTQCQNLFLITGYKGPDPETAGSAGVGIVNTPPMRMITFGGRLTL